MQLNIFYFSWGCPYISACKQGIAEFLEETLQKKFICMYWSLNSYNLEIKIPAWIIFFPYKYHCLMK